MKHYRINALACLSLLLLAACGKEAAPPAPVRPLRVLEVGAGGTATNGQPARVYSGEVRPRYASQLGFQVGGKIVARYVNVGDNVKAGQVLARLDPADTRLTVQQADAELAQADADAKRYRDLRAQRFVSQAALDARETALQAARAQAALARNQDKYTALMADKNGVIGMVMADIGKVVAPGEVIFRLAPDGDREIALNIPEAEYARFKVGMKADVTVYALPGQHFSGTVREISPLADAETRMYPMRIRLAGIERWPTGLTASVRFPEIDAGGKADAALAIPLTAVFQQGDKPAVWIVGADDSVSLRPVQIARYGDRYAYISDGIKAGERIAAAGVHQLYEGQKVRVLLDKPATAGAATPTGAGQ